MAEDVRDPQPWAAVRSAGRWADRPALGWIGATLLAASVGLGVMQPIENPDLGWHLALGRQIVETRSVPTTETFSHTASGVSMVAHEWLAQVVSYGVSEAWGLSGLRGFYGAAAAAILLILFAALRRQGTSPPLALLGISAYAVVAQGRFQVRPHMLHLLFFVALYSYLFVYKPRLRRSELLGVFAATVVWANLHSGVVLFAALVLLYVAVELIQQQAGWRSARDSDLGQGDRRRLVVLALAVVVATLLVPHFLTLFPYLVESQRLNSFMSLEWFPITHFWSQREHLAYSIETFWLIVAATGLAGFVTVGRGSSAQLVVVLCVTLLPLLGQRFLTVAFVPVLFCLGVLDGWLSAGPETRTRGQPAQAVIAVAAVLLVLVSWVGALGLPGSLLSTARGLRNGADFRADLFPMEAARILADVEPEARLYHPGRWGGYLLLANRGRTRVFSDGRWVTYGEQIVRDSAQIEWRASGFQQLLDAYAVDLLLLPRGWMSPEHLRSGEWITLFENFNSGLYLRRSPRTEADLQRAREYYAAARVPFDLELGFDERTVVAASPHWARDHRVGRMHLVQFRTSALEIARTGGARQRSW